MIDREIRYFEAVENTNDQVFVIDGLVLDHPCYLW